jgi:hypothetical protein
MILEIYCNQRCSNGGYSIETFFEALYQNFHPT